MSMQKSMNKYIVVGSLVDYIPATEQIIVNDVLGVRKEVKKNSGHNVTVVGENTPLINKLVYIALEFGAKFLIRANKVYDFAGLLSGRYVSVQDLFKLLSFADEDILAQLATNLIFDHVKNRIPQHYHLEDVLEMFALNVQPSVCFEKIRSIFIELYEEHCSKVIQTIAPLTSDGINSCSISYSGDLTRFLKENDGLFVLNAAMAAGKTLHGLLPLFKSCIEKNIKVALITPTIALSRQLATGFDKSIHYSEHKNAKSLMKEMALICCVNSAVEKDYFFNFIKECDVILVDEWGECTNQLAEKMSDKKKLSLRAKLMRRLYSLLYKQKVVLADALFSNLSAKHIVDIVGRKLTIINSSDSAQKKRIAKLLSRNNHIDIAAQQAQESGCEVGFCDASQVLSNKFFTLGEAIKKVLNGKINLINANYLNSKHGATFFKDPLNVILKAVFSLFSPAISSGLNFPFERFTRVNLFASETISPIKLIQSAGRFRNASEIQVSFVERNTEYHSNRESIRYHEIVTTTTQDEFSDEYDSVINDVWANHVIEHIVQDKFLRQNYANNMLILMQYLGVEIVHATPDLTGEVSDKAVSKKLLDSLPLLTEGQYKAFRSVFYLLTSNQREQVRIYEVLSFYNLLRKPELHQEVLEFDRNGKSQNWIRNLKLLRDPVEQDCLSSEDKVKQLVAEKVLKTLGLNSETFEGIFGYAEIEQLDKCFRVGTVNLMGKHIPLKAIRNTVLGIGGKIQYSNMGAFSKRVLEQMFGLKQSQAGRDKSKHSGEYSYQVCPASVKQLNYFYELACRNLQSPDEIANRITAN